MVISGRDKINLASPNRKASSVRTCPKCSGMLVKYGFLKKEKTQRYLCKKCRKMCSDAPNRTFGTLRTNPDKIVMVLKLLTEGMGIRATGRLTNCHRDTVLRILKHAGQRSYKLLQKKLVDVPVKHVQADEIHTTVFKKSAFNTNPETDQNPWGDFYIFLALESESKLLLMPTIGKRSERSTERFAADLNKCTSGRFQLTTDGFRPYRWHMKNAVGHRADFAQFYKELNLQNNKLPVKYPRLNKKNLFSIQCGNPDKSRITTAHVERVNLSLRTMNKRFTRKTICFSKDEEYLAYSVYLFTAFYNFCRPHSSLGKKTTPAMQAGLADRAWTVKELISIT